MKQPTVRIVTARLVKGRAWAEKNPERADELWVVTAVANRRSRRYIGPDTPENREQAEELRQEILRELDRHVAGIPAAAPTLREAIDDYLARGLRDHAATTREQRKYQLRKFEELYGRPLDRITPADLTRWWSDTVTAGNLDFRTGQGFLDALAGAFRFAVFNGHDIASPVPTARLRIKSHLGRTKSMRGRDERNRRPLTSEELVRFASELMKAPHDVRLAGLLMMDGGLRFGEALGLQWRDCEFEEDSREIRVRRSLGRLGTEPPKSGRSRKVMMSRRLRAELMRHYMAVGRPRQTSRVLTWTTPKAYRNGLEAVREAAKLARPVRPKDLRDTFASQLLTRGVPLAWISHQLGHGNVQVTARYYAAWIAEDGWRNPLHLEPGELPPDLLVTNASPSVTKKPKSKR